VGYVGADPLANPAGRRDVLYHLMQAALVDVHQCHFAPVGSIDVTDGLSDPGSPPRDDGHFAFQRISFRIHRVLLSIHGMLDCLPGNPGDFVEPAGGDIEFYFLS
jgi:hypothetical protein